MSKQRIFARRSLASKRKKAGFSQAMLASKAGITRVNYSIIENRKTSPTPANAQAIAEALGYSFDQVFMLGKDKKEITKMEVLQNKVEALQLKQEGLAKNLVEAKKANERLKEELESEQAKREKLERALRSDADFLISDMIHKFDLWISKIRLAISKVKKEKDKERVKKFLRRAVGEVEGIKNGVEKS